MVLRPKDGEGAEQPEKPASMSSMPISESDEEDGKGRAEPFMADLGFRLAMSDERKLCYERGGSEDQWGSEIIKSEEG